MSEAEKHEGEDHAFRVMQAADDAAPSDDNPIDAEVVNVEAIDSVEVEPIVLRATPENDGSYDGRANLYPNYAFDEIYEEPAHTRRFLAPALGLAGLLVAAGLGFAAWQGMTESPAGQIASISRTFIEPRAIERSLDEPEERTTQAVAYVPPAAPVYAAPEPAAATIAYSAERQELEAARAALRELGISAPTLAEGVRALARRTAAPTLLAAAAPTPAAATAQDAGFASPVAPLGCAVDGADVLGVVYFESGSVNLDAVDLATLITALTGARASKQDQTIDIVGFADGQPGVEETCANAASTNGALACLRARNVAAELARLAPTATISAASKPRTESDQPRRCGRRAEVRLRSA